MHTWDGFVLIIHCSMRLDLSVKALYEFCICMECGIVLVECFSLNSADCDCHVGAPPEVCLLCYFVISWNLEHDDLLSCHEILSSLSISCTHCLDPLSTLDPILDLTIPVCSTNLFGLPYTRGPFWNWVPNLGVCNIPHATIHFKHCNHLNDML